MEKENSSAKENRYVDSGIYKNLDSLKDCPPQCIELYLSSLKKTTYSCSEEKLLGIIDVLTGFVALNEDLNQDFRMKIIDNTVGEILPILNKKNPENIKELVSNEYKTVLENLEEIKVNSDNQTASKCLLGEAILTFPGSKIIDEGELDS